MARRKVTCALQLENWQQADDVRFLTPQQASVVIDGLTAMRDGDRAERKA